MDCPVTNSGTFYFLDTDNKSIILGLVGVYNTLGVMGQSADSIEYFCRQMWDNKEALSNRHTKFDPRFAPVPWDEERAKPGMKLTIGW